MAGANNRAMLHSLGYSLRATQCHPMSAGNASRMMQLANRYFFLEALGINPGLLFTRSQKGPSGTTSPIDKAGDFQIRSLLQAGMSIHLRIGDTLFQNTPIAWNILFSQYEGHVDAAIQDLVFLFEGFDTLFTIFAPCLSDLAGWVGHVAKAVMDDAPELPTTSDQAPHEALLRLTTRNALVRSRETLNRYTVQALRYRAKTFQTSATIVIQGLRLPRSRTDRLLALLQQERER